MSSASTPEVRRDDAGTGATEVASHRRSRVFRPEIQALRAVAVAAVVLYHLWPHRVPGGFIGVDTFFVISGFLITQHLAGEISRTGRISLSQFWARRIRRLLPAAFTVLAACVLILVTLMPIVAWQENLQEIGASAAYVENWLLGIHAVDYLAAHNSASLVQHYWSLSVEEQFYIVWPLLLLAGVFVSRLLRRKTARSAIFVALVVVFVASLAISVELTRARPPLAFFATPTRAWEFAAGGLLTMLPPLFRGRIGEHLRAGLSWLGLAVIVGCCLLLTGNEPFPGSIALLPVAGAALVLVAGASTARWSPMALASIRPVQWVGNYSYSIYLWHWPLIIAAPYALHRATDWRVKLVILALTIVLAWATKRYIEDPIRTGRRWTVRRRPAYIFAAAGMAVLLTVTVGSYHQVSRQNSAAAAVALHKVTSGAPCFGAEAMVAANNCSRPYARTPDVDPAFAAADDNGGTKGCQIDTDVTTLKFCTFGDTTNPTTTIAIVGNSHALRLVPALDLYGKSHGWKILLAAKTDCMGLITTPVGSQTTADTCLAWSAQLRKDLFARSDLDAVIFASHEGAADYLAGFNASQADLKTARDRVLATWADYRQHGLKVIVTEDVPGMRPKAGPECIATSQESYDPCALPKSVVERPNLMTDLAQANPALVSYVALNQYLCDATKCHALIGGVVVYSDSHHLTTTFSRTLAPYLGADVAKVLASPR